jgi:hypothetical protein
MTIQDLFLTPIYLFLIYTFLFIFKQKIVKDPRIKSYFFPAVTLKFIGGIALGLIYQFYYKGGDTFNFTIYGSGILWKAFYESPITALKLLFNSGAEYSLDTYVWERQIMYYKDVSAYFIVKTIFLLDFFSFQTYSVNSLFFTLFSFTGIWSMFITLYKIYPHIHKQLAFSIFFVPSIFFWGSGILKDSLTIGALGWAFYGFYHFFIRKEKRGKALIILLLSIYVLKIIKVYVVLCFIPMATIWLFVEFNNRLKSQSTRNFLKPFLIIIAIGTGLIAADYVSAENERYQLENIAHTSKETSEWITMATKEVQGSGYSLGEFDGTLSGMLKKAPSAIWVSLFRPYPWESRNAIMLVSAFESLFFLLFTILTIKQAGLFNTIKIIKTDALVFSLFVYCLTFAFAVGISTYNFGSLVRYRIPMIPFYLSLLFIIQYKAKEIKAFEKMKKKLRMVY